MRHFFTPAPTIAPLASRMGETSATAGLIGSCGRALRLPARGLGTGGIAIAVATITVTTQQHLTTATGTRQQTGRAAHRRLPADEGWIQAPAGPILPVGRAMQCTVWGALAGRLWRSEPLPRLSQRLRASKPIRFACHLPDTDPDSLALSLKKTFTTRVGDQPRLSPHTVPAFDVRTLRAGGCL
jgi:hypothetical protein